MYPSGKAPEVLLGVKSEQLIVRLYLSEKRPSDTGETQQKHIADANNSALNATTKISESLMTTSPETPIAHSICMTARGPYFHDTTMQVQHREPHLKPRKLESHTLEVPATNLYRKYVSNTTDPGFATKQPLVDSIPVQFRVHSMYKPTVKNAEHLQHRQ